MKLTAPSSSLALAVFLAVGSTSLGQPTASPAPLKTLPYMFTLAALNTTLPNANDTGVPLVLGHEFTLPGSTLLITSVRLKNFLGPDHYTGLRVVGAYESLIADLRHQTYASWPYKEYYNISLGLVGGAMHGYDTAVNASLVASGHAMTWLGSYLSSPETNQFTAVHATRGHRYASLAAHGQDALWSLCPTGNKDGKNEVFYNISSANSHSSVVVKDCYRVILQIIPVHH